MQPLLTYFKDGSSSEFVVATKEQWKELSKQNHNQLLFNYHCNMIKSIKQFRNRLQLLEHEDTKVPTYHSSHQTIGSNAETDSEPELDTDIFANQPLEIAKEIEDGTNSFGIELQTHKKRRVDAC